jgi:septal ring factor EnvC (AmiA/AmiB activator)
VKMATALIDLRWVVLVSLLLGLFLSVPWALGQDLGGEKGEAEERLEQLRQELAGKRESLKKLETTERSALDELVELQERISLAQQLLNRIHQRMRQLNKEIDSLLVAQGVASDSLDGKMLDLKLRLSSIYKQSRWYDYELLMDSDTFVNLGRRLYLLERLASYDRRIIEEIRSLNLALEKQQNLLTEDRAKLEALERESNSERALLVLEEKRKTTYIGQVRQKRRLALKAVGDLEGSVSQMESLIAELEQRILAEQKQKAEEELLASGEFMKLKGRLPWPVGGEILVPYGIVTHPVFKTKTTNPGVDIRAPLGTEVKAIADGRVIYTSWMRGYGNFVIISHPGGHTSLYGHLLETLVEVDQWVVTGQVIAKVGESGTFLGPSLHFELRRGRETLNPEEWLR